MGLLPLDGPSVQTTLSVTTIQVEVKVGTLALAERKVITVQPQDGKIYISFVSGQNGMLLMKNGIYSFEASETQAMYIKAVTGTVQVVIAERA